MTNLTIALDEEIIREARVRAIREGTSLSAKVREFLAQYARNTDAQVKAGEAILAMARASQAQSDGTKWSKDELNDRYAAWPPQKVSKRVNEPSE
jgi:plasmid stability protein